MGLVNLNDKVFKPVKNSDNGEVSGDTLFFYRQDGKVIWAEYKGGDILKGSLVGKFVAPDIIEFVYQHINRDLELLTGKCRTTIKIENQKLKLYEQWEWTCKDFSKGSSELVAV